jgi:hypothetical protein
MNTKNPAPEVRKLVTYLIAIITSVAALAANLPQVSLKTIVATGIDSPSAMAIAPDGRIFVCSPDWSAKCYQERSSIAGALCDLPVDSAGERGLLDVAFDPNFATNQFVYLYLIPAYDVGALAYQVRAPRYILNLAQLRGYLNEAPSAISWKGRVNSDAARRALGGLAVHVRTINELPESLCGYIHRLQTMADPAGLLRGETSC